MSRENRMKVCLVAISLGHGGAERSTALLSQMLKMKDYEVHVVVLNDVVDYDYAGQILNLGKFKSKNDSLIKRILRFRRLRNYLKTHQFDFLIDNRIRSSAAKELYYLNFIYSGFKVIYVVRSAKLDQYLPKKKWVANLMVKKSTKIVGVSKQISEAINKQFSTDKAVVIHNPMSEFFEANSRFNDQKYILFVGRLDEKVKNISLLLDGFFRSTLPQNNIHLKIMGSGNDRDLLVNKAKDLRISDMVKFIPFEPNVNPYLKNALFTVLTSRYEGFPRVLVESLSAGTPVVSVDCVSGPNEIVKNGFNGLLVENFNVEALAEAMDRMGLDLELYEYCKKNSKESIAHLSMANIAEEWDKLLRNEK